MTTKQLKHSLHANKCCKILIVSEGNRHVKDIKKILKQYDITHSNYADSIIKKSFEGIKLFVVDCLNGFDFLEKMIRIFNGEKAILAFIESSYEIKEYVFSIGVHDYITYPVIREELLTRIEYYNCFSQTERQSALAKFLSIKKKYIKIQPQENIKILIKY